MMKFEKPSLMEWLYLVGGLFLVIRYLFVMDDAFVYFRYIDNLLFLKIGLVYNQGEYVEGYSSPLWMIIVTLLRSTHLSYYNIIKAAAVATYILFWLMLVQVNRQLSPKKTPAINFPLAYLGFNYGVLSYFSSGTESPLIQALAIAYALYILNPTSRILQPIIATSPLIRPELTLPLILCAGWTWFYHRKDPRKMIALTLVLTVSWMLFRIYYYADLLPNTFYLKDTSYIKQGLIYINDTMSPYRLYSVALVFSMLTIILKKKAVKLTRPKNLEIANRLMMITAAAAVTIYVIKIGGDPRHYRYLAFPFCLTACAFAGILEHTYGVFFSDRHRRFVPVLGILIALTAASFYPLQFNKHPLSPRVRHKVVDYIGDHVWGDHSVNRYRLDIVGRDNIKGLIRHRKNNPESIYRKTLPGSRCDKNYIRIRVRMIHSLGLTDAILARTEMSADRPAHKWGLIPLAGDIVWIHRVSDNIGRGMYRKAAVEGDAPKWVKENLESIEVVEQKIYNEHNLWENLKLALTFPKKIRP